MKKALFTLMVVFSASAYAWDSYDLNCTAVSEQGHRMKILVNDYDGTKVNSIKIFRDDPTGMDDSYLDVTVPVFLNTSYEPKSDQRKGMKKLDLKYEGFSSFLKPVYDKFTGENRGVQDDQTDYAVILPSLESLNQKLGGAKDWQYGVGIKSYMDMTFSYGDIYTNVSLSCTVGPDSSKW